MLGRCSFRLQDIPLAGTTRRGETWSAAAALADDVDVDEDDVGTVDDAEDRHSHHSSATTLTLNPLTLIRPRPVSSKPSGTNKDRRTW